MGLAIIDPIFDNQRLKQQRNKRKVRGATMETRTTETQKKNRKMDEKDRGKINQMKQQRDPRCFENENQAE